MVVNSYDYEVLSEDLAAFPEAFATVYEDLQRLAKWLLSNERNTITLQAGDLISEAFIRLSKSRQTLSYDSKRALTSTVTQTMRRILIDHARHKKTLKSQGSQERASLSTTEHDCAVVGGISHEELMEIDDALRILDKINPTAAEIVNLRIFCGMTFEEISLHLQQPRTNIFRQWQTACDWLSKQLDPDANCGDCTN